MAITTPFAQNGDKKEIPQTSSDGSLSFDKGFGSLYALPPEEGGLFIDREQFNQLVYQITEAILANQQSLSNLSGNVYNKGEVDNLVNPKANQSTTYTKTEVNNLVNPKADKSTTYTKGEVNNLVNPKADKSTTYTKSEVDTKVNAKANANAVVNLSGNQTIAGIKTWSSPLVIPNGTANNHAVNLGQLNGKANANGVVNLSGNQTIAGIKTFSALPVCNLAPTANNHLANKAYVDSLDQVPDYSAGVNIPSNKAFVAQFNGVAELAFSAYNNAVTFSTGDVASEWIKYSIIGGNWNPGHLAGQAIIIKGQKYNLQVGAATDIHKAMIYPFKSVTQASNTRSATMSRTPPAGRLTSRETSNSGEYRR